MFQLRSIPWEAVVWVTGLAALALMPLSSQTHFTVCPLNNLGFDFCPGCGLGRSVSLLFRGELRQSLSLHPLGVLAVIVLSFRIIHLVTLYIRTLWQK